VVKLAPSWEGRGVWLFRSESELANLLGKVFHGSLHDHVLVQDFVADVQLEIRLHVVAGEVAATAFTRCQPSEGSAVQSSFGGRDAQGNWVGKYVEGETPEQVAEACFAGCMDDLDQAVAKCKALVDRWWLFLLADCAEPPLYVRFDFLVVPGSAGPKVWTGEITELGGQMCGWKDGKAAVVRAMIDTVTASISGG